MMLPESLGPYRILGKLGEGGMGEVYRARDARLDRDVAVKVLPAAVAADADRLERFGRETRALARIEHPNILTIHDVGQAPPPPGAQHPVHYAVTELLTGDTLRGLLGRERVAWRRAADLAAAIADGLAAAHAQSVVHRDLKPENLFLTTDGRVKILDFGLAASGPVADAEAPTELSPVRQTAPGTVLGTVGYMAPEQVQGGTVDGRADIFALGCVLYELVTGRQAFARATASETVAAILGAPAPELAASGTGAPPDLARIVSRCLEKQPAQRFQSAADLAFALRALLVAPAEAPSAASALAADRARPQAASASPSPSVLRRRRIVAAGAALALVAAAAAAVWFWRRPAPPVASASGLDAQRVVVAVFDNRTGDAALDALGIMASEIITKSLRRLEGMKVADNPMAPATGQGLPRSAVAADIDPVRWVADRTGAGLVVAGAYYVEGANLRAQSRLVDAATGRTVRDLEAVSAARDNPSALIDALTQRVTGAVLVRFDKRFYAVAWSAVRAPRYDAFLEARLGHSTFSTDYEASIRHYKAAISLDPTYLSPRSQLFWAYQNSGRDADGEPILREMEAPAFYSQATPAEQAIIRYMRTVHDGNRAAAALAAREIVRLMPGSTWWYHLGLSEEFLHRPRAAIEAYARLSPDVSPDSVGPSASWYLARRASLHHQLGEFQTQLDLAKTGYRHYPGSNTWCFNEIAALIGLGRTAEVDEVVRRCETLSPRFAMSTGELMYFAARDLRAHGRRDASAAMAERAVTWFRDRLDAAKPNAELRGNLAGSLLWAGRYAEALEIRAALQKEAPDDFVRRANYGIAAALAGRRAEALRVAEDLARLDRPYLRGRHLYQRAFVLAALGDREGTMRALEAAFAQGAPWRGSDLHLDIVFDSLRDYPPFIELMKPKG